jgi:hypothetical protein
MSLENNGTLAQDCREVRLGHDGVVAQLVSTHLDATNHSGATPLVDWISAIESGASEFDWLSAVLLTNGLRDWFLEWLELPELAALALTNRVACGAVRMHWSDGTLSTRNRRRFLLLRVSKEIEQAPLASPVVQRHQWMCLSVLAAKRRQKPSPRGTGSHCSPLSIVSRPTGQAQCGGLCTQMTWLGLAGLREQAASVKVHAHALAKVLVGKCFGERRQLGAGRRDCVSARR